MKNDITESPTDTERSQLISSVTQDAAKYLNLDLEQNTPIEIIKAVNEAITKTVFGESVPIPENEEQDLILGCLWGAQMVRELQWSWADIHVGNSLDIAVVSPSRDMAIYPFTFVADCIGKRRICTVELAFNMLIERKDAPVFTPGTYENVMMHVKHIVPPYALEEKS
jgi:hypothetical protein